MHVNIKNRICNHSGDLIKPGKIKTKNILINKKIKRFYFTRSVNYKSIKVLGLYFHRLM